eukprot:COSAG05_NODE_388_length_10440_cov_10.200677_4_plen_73_part_00
MYIDYTVYSVYSIVRYYRQHGAKFVKFTMHARAHTSVYFGPILLLHEYTLHSYTTKYTLHYVYQPACMPRME